jgi:hypothetical protein
MIFLSTLVETGETGRSNLTMFIDLMHGAVCEFWKALGTKYLKDLTPMP